MINRRTAICGEGEPNLYWIASQKSIENTDKIIKNIAELTNNKPFTFSIITVENWDNDLTPWAAKRPFGGGEYQGSGAKTLEKLKAEIADIEHEHGTAKRFIGGYSLAGLFSLWAFYESGVFDGAASCSGSLWYPGWDEYTKSAASPAGSIVYLSLGDKEENTKNQVMAQVGVRTRRQYELLKEDNGIIRCEFELNSGGHFRETEERMAKGFAWLIENS